MMDYLVESELKGDYKERERREREERWLTKK